MVFVVFRWKFVVFIRLLKNFSICFGCIILYCGLMMLSGVLVLLWNRMCMFDCEG